MRHVLLTLAAVLCAIAVQKREASAGGIRLGFGFPLGVFTATPNDSSYNRGHRRSRAAGSVYRSRKAAARRRAREQARFARIREAQEARQARAAARAEAGRKAETSADAPHKEAAKEKEDGRQKVENVENTTPEPPPLPPQPVTLPGGPVATSVEPSLVPSAGASEASPAPPAPAQTAPAHQKKGDCKKFVPAVGLTITVPCS